METGTLSKRQKTIARDAYRIGMGRAHIQVAVRERIDHYPTLFAIVHGNHIAADRETVDRVNLLVSSPPIPFPAEPTGMDWTEHSGPQRQVA